MERRGFRPDVAANGLEAVQIVERLPCDLMLMDCQMPEMDGYEATAQIRRREGGLRRLVISAMTAEALAGTREACLTAGMEDYISKPVRPGELNSFLGRWLPNQKAQWEAVAVNREVAAAELARPRVNLYPSLPLTSVAII
ncbi:MAG: response regulator [Candidatus Solibacter sp.]